jgi:L-lysine 2,3-aminomutase
MDIRPYYLFQARPVTQGVHFQVPLRQGIAIFREVNRQLSGIEKTFRYIMSHSSGKIEILDLSDDGRLYMRYHQCADLSQVGKVFSRPYREGACWLDDLPDDATAAAWAEYSSVPQGA